jgi:hypothetical protein
MRDRPVGNGPGPLLVGRWAVRDEIAPTRHLVRRVGRAARTHTTSEGSLQHHSAKIDSEPSVLAWEPPGGDARTH